MEAATKLEPKVSSESSYPEIVGIEGVLLDEIEEIFLVGSRGALDGLQSEIPFEIARVLKLKKLKDAFTKKMMGEGYSTGEDPDIVFARCLTLDNRTVKTQVNLGRSMSHEVMLYRWSEWYESVTKQILPDGQYVSHPSASLAPMSHYLYRATVLETSMKFAYIITKAG